MAQGNYTAEVIYLENDMYLESSTSTSFEVSKVDLKPNETNVDIKDEQNGSANNVEITLPEDATGTITVNVDGVNYTYPAHGGLNNISIDGLPMGDHNVTVTYSGDDKYDNFTISKEVNVTKKLIPTVIVIDKELTSIATDYYAGERGGMFYGILMDTNGNLLANKVVQVAINGRVYNITTDEDGKVPVQINLMNSNVYTYALFFQGDDQYQASPLASAKLTVTKKTTWISASDKKFKKSAKSKSISITLKTSKNPFDGKTYLKAGKKLTLKVNGKTYTAKINSKGVAKFNIKLAKKGKFVAKIKFAGDKTYKACSKSIKVTIK